MKIAIQALCAFVAFQHVLFLVIEMFLWRRPFGLKMFKMTQEVADSSAPLAMNQGLYNGFLAAGLVWGLVEHDARILTFFLACVVVAGVFGAATAKVSILFVQGLPAAIALALVRFAPVLLVFALLGVASADDKPEKAGSYRSATYGFSIDAPAFPKLGDEQEATILELPAPPGRAPSTVAVAVQVRPKFTLDRVRELVRGHLDKEGLHVREEKKLEVSGRKALLFLADGPRKGTETKVLELVVVDAPRIYTVTGTARTEDWARDEAALRASVESFLLEDKKLDEKK